MIHPPESSKSFPRISKSISSESGAASGKSRFQPRSRRLRRHPLVRRSRFDLFKTNRCQRFKRPICQHGSQLIAPRSEDRAAIANRRDEAANFFFNFLWQDEVVERERRHRLVGDFLYLVSNLRTCGFVGNRDLPLLLAALDKIWATMRGIGAMIISWSWFSAPSFGTISHK